MANSFIWCQHTSQLVSPPSPPQMADMYGEVMDLNSELHKRIQEQEKDIRQLRTKLLQVCCVSPGPSPSSWLVWPPFVPSPQSTSKPKPKARPPEEKW